MNSRDVIKTALASSQSILEMYLSDLSDADLLVRPVPGANHLAWQVGHLIGGEVNLLSQALPAARYPELPAGFREKHDKAASGQDSPGSFLGKKEYLSLLGKVRRATLQAVDGLSDADLDRPNLGPMAQVAPTLGALLVLAANHTTMHAGQFTVVRRKLGKPVLF